MKLTEVIIVRSLRLPYEVYSWRFYYMFPWKCLQMLFCEIVGSVCLTKAEIILFGILLPKLPIHVIFSMLCSCIFNCGGQSDCAQ